MRSVMRKLAPAALAVALSACASTPQTTSYNKATRIKGIAIQPPGVPDKPLVHTLESGGSGFSISDAFSSDSDADQGREAAAARDLQEIFTSTNYDYKKDVRESLQSAFSKSGMPIITLRGERPLKDRAKFVGQCPPVPGADTCLDVYVTFVGFTAPNPTADYVPTVQMHAKLVRMADNATLFQDQIVYNGPPSTQAIVAQSSDKHKFRDGDAMKANPQAVTDAVKEAVQSVTTTLAKQFQ